MTPDQHRASKVRTAVIVSLVLVLLLAGFGTSRVLTSMNFSGGKVLVAEGASAGNTLEATNKGGTSVLEAQGAANNAPLAATDSGVAMPDDIRAWLEHLNRIEQAREKLSSDQLSESLVMFTELKLGASLGSINGLLSGDEDQASLDETPAQETKMEFDNFRANWDSLQRDFHSLPPPAECVPIRDEYNVALSETGNMIVEITEQLKAGSEDPKAAIKTLTNMKGTSDHRVGKPSRDTDGLVSAICRKYRTKKWFSISADFGSSLFSKLGF